MAHVNSWRQSLRTATQETDDVREGIGGQYTNYCLFYSGNRYTVPGITFIVVFLGIFLIIASLDIEKRAWFVFWEGLTRIFVFLFFLYFVLFSSAAQILLLFGIIDLIIGIIYMYFIFTIKDLKLT